MKRCVAIFWLIFAVALAQRAGALASQMPASMDRLKKPVSPLSWVEDAAAPFSWMHNGDKRETSLVLVSRGNPPAAAEETAPADPPLMIDRQVEPAGWGVALNPHAVMRPTRRFGNGKAVPIHDFFREFVEATVVSPHAAEIRLAGPDDAKYQVELIALAYLDYEPYGEEYRLDVIALNTLGDSMTDENAAFLASFLHDRTYSQADHKWAPHTYPLRQRAYDILKRNGRTVPEPVTEEATVYVPIHRSSGAGSIALAMVLLTAVPLVQRRFLAAGAVLSGGMFVLLLLAMVTRGQTVRELAISVGHDTFELGSYPDGLHLKRRISFSETRVPLSYAEWATASLDSGWEPPELVASKSDRVLGVTTGSGIASVSPGIRNFGYIILPHWLALAIFGVLPASWAVRCLTIGPGRRARRIRRGLCGECGYDVRVNTGGHCPECGSSVTASIPQPA